MSYLPPGKVKQGFWIDLSKGPVLGSTITTDTTTGNVVVAVFAIIVSLASLHLWHLCLFAFYQIRASKDTGDGLYRQQQALLRSLSDPEKTLVDFAELCWAWYGKASVYRTIIPVLLALIFSVTALATSISSSLIVSSSNITILVNSDNCGFFTTNLLRPVVQSYTTASSKLAEDYASSCYLMNLNSGPCVKYVQPRIQYSKTRAPCPFADSLCIKTDDTESPAISLDTGYLDSNTDFGLNAAPADRVKIRKKTTCAPITIPGYYITIPLNGKTGIGPRPPLPGEELFRLLFGTQPGFHGPIPSHYSYSTYLSNTTLDYTASSKWSGPSYSKDDTPYKPIPQMIRADADTVFVFIFFNLVQSQTPINDPVFAAHNKTFYLSTTSSSNFTTWIPDNPMGLVSCAEQYQYCIYSTDSNICTDLGGIPTRTAQAALGANKNQLATFGVFHNALLNADVSVVGNSPNPVLGSATVAGGLQSFLPPDQWEKEVDWWESLALSNIQKSFTDQAIGPGIRGENGKEAQFDPPSTPARKKLCNAQKMKVDGGFANINVFGLAFTVAIAGILVIADLCCLRIFTFASRFRTSWAPRVDRWIQDGLLQLQRKAYEGLRQGEWSQRDQQIPLVAADAMLPDFQLTQPALTSQAASTVNVASRQTSHSAAAKPPPDGQGLADAPSSTQEAVQDAPSPISATLGGDGDGINISSPISPNTEKPGQ